MVFANVQIRKQCAPQDQLQITKILDVKKQRAAEAQLEEQLGHLSRLLHTGITMNTLTPLNI